MCGRYFLDAEAEELAGYFGLASIPALLPRYNIAPSQSVAAVRAGTGGRELAALRWGLVPAWSKEEKSSFSLINARAETVAEKPAFRNAFRRRRCLIPAAGFYEWQVRPGGKQPWCIRSSDGRPLAFAGLWEHWEGDAGRVVESCTIVVTEANETVRPIHERMPVILDPAAFDLWLDPNVRDPARLQPLLRPCPAARLSAYPVSRRINSPANDDPECLRPQEA